MKIVVSSCLMGLPTRYDGRSREAEFPAWCETAEIVHFCPEAEAGLGIPRECIELVRCGDGGVRVLGRQTHADFTDRLVACCSERIARLQSEGVDLFVLKARSPSCGKVGILHDREGNEIGTAPGIWAGMVGEFFPDVPCITEEELGSWFGDGIAGEQTT